MMNNNMQQKDDSLNDMQANVQPTDSVSAFSWFFPDQQQKILAAACWDGKIKVYSLQPQGLMHQFDVDMADPIQDLCWKQDGSMIIAACANSVKVLNVSTKQVSELGKHQAGISHVFWSEQFQIIISTGFDKMLNFWSLNQPGQPAKSIQINKKIYTAAVKDDLIILGLQEEKIMIDQISRLVNTGQLNPSFMFDSGNLGQGSQVSATQLGQRDSKYVYAVASIDGRANLSHFKPNNNQWQCDSIMTFKCHKEEKQGQQLMHVTNSIGFNPRYESFVFTAGSEGKMYFWDIQQKNKIKSFSFNGQPVTCAAMAPDGSCIVYALGYDWHAGVEKFNQYKQYKICVHAIPDNELKYSK